MTVNCYINNEPIDANTFHVMLLPLPSRVLNSKTTYLNNKRKNALIAVDMKEGGFAFLSINTEEITAINNAMLATNCELNKWYFCNIYKTGE